MASITPRKDSPDLPTDPNDLLKRSLVLQMPLDGRFHVGICRPSVVPRVEICVLPELVGWFQLQEDVKLCRERREDSSTGELGRYRVAAVL